MDEIKPLVKNDIEPFIDIARRAFPGMGITSEEARGRFKKRLLASYDYDDYALYGLYRDKTLLGGMLLHDFEMNVFGHILPVGGVGLVVVSLLHKREHVAKDLITYFIDHYRSREYPLLALYPFRPDFYKRMGFGYGTKKNKYRIDPSAFPRYGKKSNIRYLNADDAPEVLACFNRYANKTHGMILGKSRMIERYLLDPARIFIGYEKDSEIKGYISFKFDKLEDYPVQELVIEEFIYETREAMVELLAFLNTQHDQISRIVLSNHDDMIHFLIDDPRSDSNQLIHPVFHESNTQGIGIMYRVVDVKNLFSSLPDHNFGGESCSIRFDITDTFYPDNAGEFVVQFNDGRVRTDQHTFDVNMEMDISDFSSMVMGVVTFKKLYEYNRTQISDTAYLEKITRLFRSDEPPICLTFF